MMGENSFFTLEIRDNILDFTMNAPVNNLMTGEFISGFIDAVEEAHRIADKNKNLKGIIIHGAGRHFSTGADVTSLVERTSAELDEMERTGNLPEGYYAQKNAITSLNKFSIPVVSVIGGFCIGSGSEIAVNTHFRICEPTSRLGQPESTFGLLPALGGIARTAKICGLASAIDSVMTGELFTCDYADETGWADILCEKKKGYDTAVRLINYIDSLGSDFDPECTAEYIFGFKGSEVQ